MREKVWQVGAKKVFGGCSICARFEPPGQMGQTCGVVLE